MTSELLAAYDAQLRGSSEVDEPNCDGPVVRQIFPFRGFVSYRNLDGYRGADLDALIARQIDYFGAQGLAFEWKTRSHDEPADLSDRLLRLGFVPEDQETVVVGETASMAVDPVLPEGVTLRPVTAYEDFARIAALKSEVWDDDWHWLADDLRDRQAEAPDDIVVLAAEVGDLLVSAAWLVFKPGTEFAGLWGGSTLAAWRGRGVYRALVARRAQLAATRGVKYLQVDASDDSRPILERLGFVAITTTTPYVWTPSEPAPPEAI